MPRSLTTAAAALGVAAALLAGCAGDAAGADDAAWVAPSVTPGESSAAPAGDVTPGPSSPAARTPSPKTRAPSPKPTPKPAPKPGKFDFVFPVRTGNVAYHPTHGGYPATDIFAACGSPVVAPIAGTVLEVSRKDTYVKGKPDGPANGGLSVSILGADGARYYGSHLKRIAAGIAVGTKVKAGQRLGDLGKTGNANNVCHLHFGISAPCAKVGDWKVRRGVIWPKKYLDSWRRGTDLSAAAAAAAWAKKSRCRA